MLLAACHTGQSERPTRIPIYLLQSSALLQGQERVSCRWRSTTRLRGHNDREDVVHGSHGRGDPPTGQAGRAGGARRAAPALPIGRGALEGPATRSLRPGVTWSVDFAPGAWQTLLELDEADHQAITMHSARGRSRALRGSANASSPVVGSSRKTS